MRITDARTIQDNPALALAFKEVVVRFEEAFRPENLFVMDWRDSWVAAIAEVAWEENAA